MIPLQFDESFPPYVVDAFAEERVAFVIKQAATRSRGQVTTSQHQFLLTLRLASEGHPTHSLARDQGQEEPLATSRHTLTDDDNPLRCAIGGIAIGVGTIRRQLDLIALTSR